MKFSYSAIAFALLGLSTAAIIDNEGVANVPRDSISVTERAENVLASAMMKRAAPQDFADNRGRTVANGGCCNHGVNLRQDICFNGEKGRCIPAASTREGCVGLTCVVNSKLTCDPNQQDRGRDKCTLIAGQ